MDEHVLNITVERLKHRKIGMLLQRSGFYNDHGWKRFVKSLNELTPSGKREVDLVIFRPTEEEFVHCGNSYPPVYAARKLRPASLFEVLSAIPTEYDARKKFCELLGNNFILMVHGHYASSWLGRSFVYAKCEYGALRSIDCGVLSSRSHTWYAGFRNSTQTAPST